MSQSKLLKNIFVKLGEDCSTNFKGLSVRMKKTGCRVVESLRLLVPRVEVGAGRHGLNV